MIMEENDITSVYRHIKCGVYRRDMMYDICVYVYSNMKKLSWWCQTSQRSLDSSFKLVSSHVCTCVHVCV